MAPPLSTKEQVGAALQQAGQYAGTRDVLTPENAPSYGLDPEKGYINPQVGVSQPPQGTWNPAPILKQVLETKVPIPSFWQSQPDKDNTQGPWMPIVGQILHTQVTPGQKKEPAEKGETAPEIPGAVLVKPADILADSSPQKPTPSSAPKIPGAVLAEPADTAPPTQAAAPEQIPQIPGATLVPETQPPQPQQAQPQPPQPAPQPSQPATPMPSGTGAGAPQGEPADPHAQIQALIKTEGKTPGEAQSIVAGQEPTTVTGETPPPKPAPPPKTEQPQQQAPQPIDSLKADDKNRVDPVALYSYLLGKFANSGLVGYVPPDGAKWGIKTGSAAEWAAFGLAVAKQESDLNARSYNAADPGGSAGLFQFGQGQKPYVQGDQFNPQQSADAFIRAVQHYLANKGSIANLGEIFGSIKRPNEAGQYLAGAQKVAAGGSGKDLVSSGGGGGGNGGGGDGVPQPMIALPSSGGAGGPRPSEEPSPPRFGGHGGGGRETIPKATGSSGDLTQLAEAAALSNLFRGGEEGGGRAQVGPQPVAQPSEEPGPSPSAVVAKVLQAGGPPPAPGGPVDLSTMKQANVLGVRTPGAQLGLPGPPPAPSAAAPTPDPSVIKGLMKAGFTFEQANAFAAKALVSKPGAATITGGASFRKPAQLPAPPPAPSRQAPAAKPQPQAPQPQPAAPPPKPQAPPRAGIAPKGSTVGVPNPPGSEALAGLQLAQALKHHATLLSPDDPRVKKQADNMTKGEHFVPGDPVHEDLLNGLPGGQGGRQRQILAQAEQAIAEKRPMHLSYISAPKEAQKFPTRESRTIQYEAHSPEARLMGTTEGQLVGHSMIPVSVGVSPSRKADEPHQGYIQGLSTNVIANNFAHLNTKLAAMGQKTPYARFGPKFANDLEGYLHNLNAGHTGTGRGYALGTAEYPNEPETSHVPYKLTRHEADFLNTVINNTGAFAKHEDAKALRELARINGTLITPEGETNRLRHQIEQHEPGWRQRVLEPSIRSFKTGLIHEVHPSEEHMPATIRPGQDYRDVTEAMQRTSERGRPDVPVSVSLHHTFADNKAINQIERDFSEERISEADARARLHALGEDPDQYRFVGGSGGLITPYEENPEAITPEEHSQLKDNLRKQWIGGKMPIEDYRRKTADVPLPEIPSRPAAQQEGPSEESVTPPKPKPPKPAAPTEPAETETPEEPAAEPPAPVKQRGFKAYKQPSAAPPPAPATPAKAPEAAAPEEEPPEKEPAAAAPTEAPIAPPAPGEPLPAAKAKKPAKTKEEKAAEAEDLRQAAVDRNDIPEKDTKQLNRLQRVAKGWIKQNPELHPLSAHTYLTGQKEFPNQGELTKAGIGEHFDADNPKLDFEKEEHREHAAGGIVHDIMHALAGTKTGNPSTAWGWYDRAVRKTLAKVSQIAPKILSDPEHALAFKLGTAITSQGQDVFPNAVSGWHVYRHWVQNGGKAGGLPTDAKVFGGGPKADAMVQNFTKVNDLWKELGTAGLQKVLTTKMTVRQLRDDYGLEIDEPLDTKVYGAMALGPKIGAFFSNLHGNFDPTTIDMWFSRTMNRLGGNMFGFSDKAMRQDRMEKGKLVKSHLSELSDLLNSGQLTGVDQNRTQKMQAELAALKAHPQGQLTRAKALQLAPEIHNWAKERTNIYAQSKGYERSFHPDLKTPENVLGKKLHEGVNDLSDAPRTASERRHWHDIMARVDTHLRNAGVKLTNADKQALLWFVEKDLFRQGGSNSKVNADYLDAAYRLVRKVKSGELPGLEQANQPSSGGVLKMQGGGFVQPPQPSEVPGLMGQLQQQGQTQPVGQTQPAQTSAQAQGTTQPLNAPSPQAPGAPSGTPFTPMPQETGKVPIPLQGFQTAEQQARFPGSVRTKSMWVPGQRLTHDLKWGAAEGGKHLMTNNDIAMSPDLMKKYGYKLGDRVDVFDSQGNVLYPNQFIGDVSYVSPGKPNSNTIELWGRGDVGYSSIKRSPAPAAAPAYDEYED